MTVIVIGGGIVGLASAYELAARDIDVVVCEQGSIGNGSTERAAGGIRAQFSTPVNVDLSLASMRTWEAFEERFGTDIDYRRTGYLFLARSEDTAERLETTVAMQNERGVPSEVLEPETAHARCPGIDPERFVAATYSPTDGFADPHLALQGYARAAADAGVDVRTKTPVVDVLRERSVANGSDDDGRVTGVETPDGRLEAEFVVNAAGPWAGEIAATADVPLPIAPKRRQIAIVEPERPAPETDPFAIDLEGGSYFRPDRDGDALVGGHFGESNPDADPDAYARSMDFEWAVDALESVSEWATYFGPESAIKRGWAGLYAVTPDDSAIVEETVPGFVTAAGFSGHGFQHAPATGKLVAELVTEGEASLVDIESLSSDRFDRSVERAERNVV
ncbi:NAD(P)/FAD-dependent oxidoreductase [Natronorubrum halophilum]|uniref:NAD(P)/FAD-dependent oxidoreductase n=1 Tax=Natronorubrum halophilum TaxID=1702106 RepID=UPI000EF70B7C|nr:FAD-dependent oxidoreductase [Natronorubrum halophilum]